MVGHVDTTSSRQLSCMAAACFAQALATRCGQGEAELLRVETLDLSGKPSKSDVWDGIGAFVELGKAQSLKCGARHPATTIAL